MRVSSSDGQLEHSALSIASVASVESVAARRLRPWSSGADGRRRAPRHGSGCRRETRRHHRRRPNHGGQPAARRGRRRAVRLRAPDAGVVVVVPAPTRGETRDLLAAGADALVLDGEGEAVLAAAVRSASLGHISVPRPFRECLDRPALSHRESQIIGLVAAGCTNAQIAHRLCLSESTVKAHLSSAFRRLGVRSRREAAAAVLHRY